MDMGRTMSSKVPENTLLNQGVGRRSVPTAAGNKRKSAAFEHSYGDSGSDDEKPVSPMPPGHTLRNGHDMRHTRKSHGRNTQHGGPQPPSASPPVLDGEGQGEDADLSQLESTGPDSVESVLTRICHEQKIVSQLLTEHGDQINVALEKHQKQRAQSLGRHKEEMTKILLENTELHKRMNAVLTTTWSMGNESWQGAPREPLFGALSLMCEPGKAQDGKWSWEISQEEMEAMREQKMLNFNARPVWQSKVDPDYSQTDTRVGNRVMMANRTSAFGNRESGAMQGEEGATDGEPTGPCRCMITKPTSVRRLYWEVAGVCLLMYDIIMIPISFFNPKESFFLTFMEWVTQIFWTFDMVASLFTGYISQGIVVMDQPSIIRHYLRTWFWIDVLVVVPDWALTGVRLSAKSSSEDGHAGVGSLLKTVRAIRVIRLLRLTKMRKYIIRWKDSIESQITFIMFEAVQQCVFIMLLQHFVGSVWYLVGDLTRDLFDNNWIEAYGWTGAEDLSYRYLSSLHWSLSHFALGTSTLHATNSIERVFSILVMLLGLMTFTFFTSSCVSWLTQIRQLKGQTEDQFWLLRRYFRQHNIQGGFRFRLLKYLQYQADQLKDSIPESKLTVLALLSENMRNELEFLVHYYPLRVHPLFAYAESSSQHRLYALSMSTFRNKAYAREDMIFQRGIQAPSMYIPSSGTCLYATPTLRAKTTIERGNWLCEHALWVSWTCRGDCICETDVVMIEVDVKDFILSIPEDEVLWLFVSRYADTFVAWLNDEDVGEITDVLGDPVDFDMIGHAANFVMEAMREV
jgi:hypothetical protein